MNNKSNRLIVAFLGMAFTAGTFLSCKDKKTNDPTANCTTCHSVLEAKDYFAFKEGSYWVYEEETTHERDSMYVTQSWVGTDYDFYIKIKSQLTDFEYTYWPSYYPHAGSCSETKGVTGKCLYVNRSKGKPNLLMGDLKVFFINYKIGETIITYEPYSENACSSNMISPILELDNYAINNYTFTEIIKVNESCSYHYNQQSVNLYYSKGVGIVRKELVDSNQVWNLVKYKIAL